MDRMPEDLIINLGEYFDGRIQRCVPLSYNVSNFLREYEKMDYQWQANIKQFIKELDKDIKVDIREPQHKEIRMAISEIVNSFGQIFLSELPKMDLYFRELNVIKSGSLYNGTRAGAFVEADWLIELTMSRDEAKRFDVKKLRNYMTELANEIAQSYNNESLVIHGIQEHSWGICLVMEYRKEGQLEGTGVLVDVVPVFYCCDGGKLFSDLNYSAQIYLNENVPACNRNNYTVHSIYRHGFLKLNRKTDTGKIEHYIIRQQSDAVKSGIRVAKFLLQETLLSGKPCIKCSTNHFKHKLSLVPGSNLDQEKSLRLYGYEPLLRSHMVQVFVLTLLFQAYGTPEAEKLTGSRLTLCLMDMVYNVTHLTTYTMDYLPEIDDPVLKHRKRLRLPKISPSVASRCWLKRLSCSMLKHASDPDLSVEDFKRSNVYIHRNFFQTLYNMYVTRSELYNRNITITGFCRGSPPEQLAKAQFKTANKYTPLLRNVRKLLKYFKGK